MQEKVQGVDSNLHLYALTLLITCPFIIHVIVLYIYYNYVRFNLSNNF